MKVKGGLEGLVVIAWENDERDREEVVVEIDHLESSDVEGLGLFPKASSHSTTLKQVVIHFLFRGPRGAC